MTDSSAKRPMPNPTLIEEVAVKEETANRPTLTPMNPRVRSRRRWRRK
jgi:hypothetical protein